MGKHESNEYLYFPKFFPMHKSLLTIGGRHVLCYSRIQLIRVSDHGWKCNWFSHAHDKESKLKNPGSSHSPLPLPPRIFPGPPTHSLSSQPMASDPYLPRSQLPCLHSSISTFLFLWWPVCSLLWCTDLSHPFLISLARHMPPSPPLPLPLHPHRTPCYLHPCRGSYSCSQVFSSLSGHRHIITEDFLFIAIRPLA